MTLRFRARTLVPILATLVAAACSGDATSPSRSIIGTWQLETLGGKPMPYVWDEEIVLVGGSMELRVDSTFREVETWRENTSTTPFNTTLTGRYSRSGSTLTFLFDRDQHTEQATLGHGTMTFHTSASASGDWVYRAP